MPASTPSSDTTPRMTRACAGKNGYAAQMIALPPSPAWHSSAGPNSVIAECQASLFWSTFRAPRDSGNCHAT